MLRKACVSGRFYPGESGELRETVRALAAAVPGTAKKPALGIIVPHAGHVYSGAVAGAVYGRLAIPPLVVMLGPNHTGQGPDFSLWPDGSWQTPLGAVAVSPLARGLLAASAFLEADYSAHLAEHSLEVQVPFLQVCGPPDIAVIPVAIACCEPEAIAGFARELAAFVRGPGAGALILASSDMSHFETDERTREKDGLALEAVRALDPEKLVDRVARFNISMCGFAPAAVMLQAARELGACTAEQVAYDTSAATSGDYRRAVGYAGVIVS